MRVVGYLHGGRVAGLDCDSPLRAVCSDCDVSDTWACQSHRESRCAPCAERYRRRLARIAEAGSRVHADALAMLTLTAPGERLHRLPSGAPCPCTPAGGVDLAAWNASASKRWNHYLTLLRRLCPGVQYLRAVEVQKRGALHLHVIVRVPRGSVLPTLRELRQLAIRCGFGHELDRAWIEPGSKRHAYYVSKYVTKAGDSREDVPWAVPVDVPSLTTGEMKRVVTSVPGRYRTWSSSRSWGLTMSDARAVAAKAARLAALARTAPTVSPHDRDSAPATDGPAPDGPDPG